MMGALVELFTVLICLRFFGCDVQQERNWEDSKHLVGTSGDDSSALIEFTPL